MSDVHYPPKLCGEPMEEHPEATCIRPYGHLTNPSMFREAPLHLTHWDGKMIAWRPFTDRDVIKGLEQIQAYSDREARELVAVELETSETEIGEADGYMRMLDPDHPWRLLTSDGNTWVQCAKCDAWLQADECDTYDEAQSLAELHRATQWPHVMPATHKAVQAPVHMSRRARRKAARSMRKQARCPKCGIRTVFGKCHNYNCTEVEE